MLHEVLSWTSVPLLVELYRVKLHDLLGAIMLAADTKINNHEVHEHGHFSC